jgi:hypothetical protein
VGDDVALGQMLKRAGGRPGVFKATGLVSLQMYPSMRAMGRAMEKAALPILGRFHLSVLFATGFTLLLVEVVPFVLCTVAPAGLARALGGVASALLLTAAAAEARWCQRPWLATLAVPLGTAIMVAMTLAAGVKTWLRGEITWRDTRYSLKALREGQRLEFL